MAGRHSHSFHPSILRAYDIRGVVGSTLSQADAYAIGVGFAAAVRAKSASNIKIVVGRDGRLSSPDLATGLLDGLVGGGLHVIDMGMVPTPMVYFASRQLDTAAAIQVTGSHNPPDHNGFKMVLGGAPFFGDDILGLGECLAKGVSLADGGKLAKQDMADAYHQSLLAYAKPATLPQSLNIVWDCGNGVVGPTLAKLTQALPGRHNILCGDVDGTFPNHHPDPTDPSTLAMLKDAMATHKATLGIGFDGDGDRIGVTDGKGRHIVGDIITAYLAQGVLRRQAAADIIFDIKSSLAATEAVAKAGGKPQLWKTGRSHMEARLNATNAPLAGEMSGHIFLAKSAFAGAGGYDDALLAALAILREQAESGVSISEFIDTLPKMVTTPEKRLPWDDADKFQFLAEVAQTLAASPPTEVDNILDIDGVRVNYPNGWWLLRASNTGAELVTRCEGRDQASVDYMQAELARYMTLAKTKRKPKP